MGRVNSPGSEAVQVAQVVGQREPTCVTKSPAYVSLPADEAPLLKRAPVRRVLVSLISLLLLVSGLAGAAPVRVTTKHFSFVVEESRVAMANELAADADSVLREVCGQLGVLPAEPTDKSAVMAPMQVRIVHSEAEFIEAMPNHRNIEWAAGVAFPNYGIIVLRIDQNTRFEIHDVFRHEMSHVVLGRATKQAEVPMWFVEGLAVHQAGEKIRERWQKAADATLTESLPPLSTLTDGFPADGASADFAYAQSTAFMSHLLANGGWSGMRALIAKLAAGQAFDAAVAATWGQPLPQIEADFRETIAKSASWLPIIFGSSVLTAVAGLLFLGLAWRRRSQTRRRLSKMGDPLDDEFA